MLGLVEVDTDFVLDLCNVKALKEMEGKKGIMLYSENNVHIVVIFGQEWTNGFIAWRHERKDVLRTYVMLIVANNPTLTGERKKEMIANLQQWR